MASWTPFLDVPRGRTTPIDLSHNFRGATIVYGRTSACRIGSYGTQIVCKFVCGGRGIPGQRVLGAFADVMTGTSMGTI